MGVSRSLARRDGTAVTAQQSLHSRTLLALRIGEGHSSYALYVRKGGRRFSIYVPNELAPELERAIGNGRHSSAGSTAIPSPARISAIFARKLTMVLRVRAP